jgi:hypothetical protein
VTGDSDDLSLSATSGSRRGDDDSACVKRASDQFRALTSLSSRHGGSERTGYLSCLTPVFLLSTRSAHSALGFEQGRLVSDGEPLVLEQMNRYRFGGSVMLIHSAVDFVFEDLASGDGAAESRRAAQGSLVSRDGN